MFFNISSTYLWFGLAILFGGVELATTSLVSIWFVAGSLAALLVSLVIDSLAVELIAFILVSTITLVFTRPILAGKLLKSTPTNADMLIGKTARVTQVITKEAHGRAEVDGLTWRATAQETINEGEVCTITKIEGVTLLLEKQKVAAGQLQG